MAHGFSLSLSLPISIYVYVNESCLCYGKTQFVIVGCVSTFKTLIMRLLLGEHSSSIALKLWVYFYFTFYNFTPCLIIVFESGFLFFGEKKENVFDN